MLVKIYKINILFKIINIRNKIINLVFALKTSYSNPFDAKFLINLILNYSFIFDWIIQK